MKKTIFLLVTLLLSIGTFAQSEVIYTVSNTSRNNSIVRQWGNDKYLIYTEDSSINEKFILVDSSSQAPNAKEVSLKKRYKIKDFAVHHDTVFFIGVYFATGFWGYFDINNVFNNGGNITYFLTDNTLPPMSIPSSGTFYSFVDFDELQVLPRPGAGSGSTELLLTGLRKNQTYSGGMPIFTTYTPCLFHVKPPYTSFDYAFNESINEKFDDIALNGNNIVVVGRENYLASDSANILFRIFEWPNFDFTATISKELTRQSHTLSMSKVLIEPLGNLSGNTFATAHYGNHNPSQGLIVELYSIQPIVNNPYLLTRNYCTFVWQSNPLATGCTLKKAAYNTSAYTFCVLQDMASPLFSTNTSTICKVNYTNFSNITCSTSSHTSSGISINSVSNGINSNILYSGCVPYKVMLIRENVANSANCMDHGTLTVTTDNDPKYNLHEYGSLTKKSHTAARSQFSATPGTITCLAPCVRSTNK